MKITFAIYWSYNQPIGTKFSAHMKFYKNLTFYGQKGRGQGHVGTPSVTFERVKLDTSFFISWIGLGEYYTADNE